MEIGGIIVRLEHGIETNIWLQPKLVPCKNIFSQIVAQILNISRRIIIWELYC